MQTVDGILEAAGDRDALYEKDIVSVDSKVSCGAGRQSGADDAVKALQALNVYSNGYRMCLAQRFIDEKTNEIPTAQDILSMMDLMDTIVTADAMNCQKGTAVAVIKGKGDYVLALKGNQPLFYKEVMKYFDGACLERLRKEEGCYRKTVEPEHGELQSGNTISRRM